MVTIPQIRTDLYFRIIDAVQSYEILWLLEAESDFRTDHLEAMNVFRNFFIPTIYSHEVMFLLRLAALNDTAGKDCITIRRLFFAV